MHEEIRDLLQAYARHKGWLETDNTRALHGKLWDYLNSHYLAQLPPELRAQVNREGLLGDVEHLQRIEKQLSNHLNLSWMLEACYHRALSLTKLPGNAVTPAQFWQSVGGSAVLSPLVKWLVMENLPDLSPFLVSWMTKGFDDELLALRKGFGDETAHAIWQAQTAGHPDVFHDTAFWERRILEQGLPGDYFGFQEVLHDVDPKRCNEVQDEMLQRFGNSTIPAVQEQCAIVLYNKGVALSEKLNNPAGGAAVYDDLLERFGKSTVPIVQEHCAKALFNKGVTFSKKLADPAGAVSVYDDLLHRFGESTIPAVQELCALALHNKGWTLSNKLDDSLGAVAVYDDLLQRFGNSTIPAVQEQCAKALVNKGVTLGRLNDLSEAVDCYDDLLARYRQLDHPAVKALCQDALAYSAELLLVLGRKEESIRRIHLVLAQTDLADKKYAVMHFLLWLATVDTPLAQVLDAIRALLPTVTFTGNWDDIRPLVNTLAEPRKTQANCFIDFFDQHHDLARLERCLAANVT